MGNITHLLNSCISNDKFMLLLRVVITPGSKRLITCQGHQFQRTIQFYFIGEDADVPVHDHAGVRVQ